MKKLLSLYLFIILSCGISVGQENHDTTFLELPQISSSDIVIKYEGFTVCYDTLNKIPVWVAYQLTAEETKGAIGREGSFTQDKDFSWPQANTRDYSNSGYDRGHMAPAADMKWSEKAMKDCFHLTNICPQNPSLNRRDWKALEDRCRDWAQRFGYIYIVCGPIIENESPETIGANNVTVPDAFFKAVVTCSDSTFQGIGFIYENAAEVQRMQSCTVTIDSVEVRTGLNLFQRLDEKVEQSFEKHFWGLW